MTDDSGRTARPMLDATCTRRGLFKGALGAGASAAALATFGADFMMSAATVRAADDEMLDPGKFTIKNTIAINLTKHFARVPLHQGSFNGQPVWYVMTEASDQGIASDLGLNFSPRLANIPPSHPAVQQVASTDPVVGRGMVTFAGMPNFSPMRMLTPGPMGFPPAAFAIGAAGDAKYSDLVRVQGGNVVFNAPIIAVGTGPFDVTTHTNTHDRVLAIDTGKMTVDLLIVRAFAFGREIIYHSFSASDGLTSVIERGTFIPAMAKIPMTDTRTPDDGARSAIFAFVNGKAVLESPPGQGLNHVILNGRNAEEATLQNMNVLDALRRGGDSRNVLDTWPILPGDPARARRYSPLWDLQMGRWSDAAVAQGLNNAQTDSNQIRQRAAEGLVTSSDGAALVTHDIVINCPALAFTDQPPMAPQAPDPGRSASPLQGAP